jgi:flavin reductase (DIM6/NTAB) family NADH-FMN oxidoreductase RutF
MQLDPVDSTAFRQVCARFATGITVTTTRAEDGSPQGLTASSFTSVSLNPPLILVCIDHNSGVLQHFRTSAYFAVNILREEQEEVSNLFAFRKDDRFEEVSWRPGKTGSPLLEDCLAHLECAVYRILDVGDHAVAMGEVVHADIGEGLPLLYYGSAYQRLKEIEAGLKKG